MAERGDLPPFFPLTEKEVTDAASQLGPKGPGIALLQSIIDPDHLSGAIAEITDPARVTWRDNRSIHTNQRGVQIHQNYDVYALNLHSGDQEMIDRLPVIQGLIKATENLITGQMAEHFHSLQQWRADEVDLHRYDAGRVGITHHRDNKRFWGMIGILTLAGERELSLRIRGDDRLTSFALTPGDLVLMRAPELYATTLDSADIRPEHGVDNRFSNGGTSMVVRSSTNPDQRYEGYTYDNWPIK